MGHLPINLPMQIKNVLEMINFDFDDDNLKYPCYIATYSEVRMRGWDTAQSNLKANLEKVIQLLKKDKYHLDAEKHIAILNSEIENLAVIDNFYSEDFYSKHRKKYLGILKKLSMVKQPLNNFNFPGLVKTSRTILNNNEPHVTDNGNKKHNPFIKEYNRLYKRVNPKYFLRNPISEIYEFFNGDLKRIYQNEAIRKNCLDKDISFLRRQCLKNTKGLFPNLKFTPFSYIVVPDFLLGNEKEIKIFTGNHFAGLNGKTGVNIYKKTGSTYECQGAM